MTRAALVSLPARLLCAAHLGKRVGVVTKDGAEVRDILTSVGSDLQMGPDGERMNDVEVTVLIEFKTIAQKAHPSVLGTRQFELDPDSICTVTEEEE